MGVKGVKLEWIGGTGEPSPAPFARASSIAMRRSFSSSASTYIEMPTNESQKWAEMSPPGFDPEAYETKQVFYTSKDGTPYPAGTS